MQWYNKIRDIRIKSGMSQDELAKKCGYRSRSSINKIEMGQRDIPQKTIAVIAKALQVSPAYLMGWDENMEDRIKAPEITEDVFSFPVLGEIAAGWDEIAIQDDWSGDRIEIPMGYIKSRNPDDYFVLRVHGDSMYPMYLEGDKVLIRKQPTLDHSGQIGAVIYDGDCATLKKIEYKAGEDWMRMIPINPEYMPKIIDGCNLEQCRVLGIPVLLIRDIHQG